MKKLRIWESNTLADMLTLTSQIEAGIDNLANNVGVQSLGDLPHSLVPTSTLYELCLCYRSIYDTLLEHDLLSSGNIKSTSSLN